MSISASLAGAIFDGFDEMKHGMTLSRFEANITELMRLDRGQFKVLILGRDTAFHDDLEFRAIIHGRQITAGGQDVQARDRRAFREIQVRDFTLEEARTFVERYFPIAAQEATRGAENPDPHWIEARREELLDGSFDHHYVNRDENLALWTFLHSARISQDQHGQIVVGLDLREATRRLTPVLRIGFAENSEDGAPAPLVAAPVQTIYRAWGVREAELERVRPFFGEEKLWDKIRPLEVEFKASGRSETSERETKPSQPANKLTLPQAKPRVQGNR